MRAAVVVRPEVPGNTGFIARLCENFDFSLRVVEPGFNLEKARKTASSAQESLRNAEIFDTVEDAVDDLDYVVGTKPGRGVEIDGLEPRNNTSVMIGPESSGLSNEELELCDSVVHIETGEYDSLNQSHAAAIVMHRLRDTSEVGMEEGQKQQLEQLLDSDLLEELLLRANPSRGEMDRLLGDLHRLAHDST
ncbi:MAG: RNA methyltransferase [Candidatus Nanohaloarchaea archaeon]